MSRSKSKKNDITPRERVNLMETDEYCLSIHYDASRQREYSLVFGANDFEHWETISKDLYELLLKELGPRP